MMASKKVYLIAGTAYPILGERGNLRKDLDRPYQVFNTKGSGGGQVENPKDRRVVWYDSRAKAQAALNRKNYTTCWAQWEVIEFEVAE
jgi:hypothetical protein